MSEFLKVQKYNADGTPRAGKWATGCPEWETIGSVVTVGSFTYTVKRAVMANGALQCVVNMAVKGTRQSILLTAAQCAELPGTEVVVTMCAEFLPVALVPLWQLKQLVPPTGTCAVDLPLAAAPLWQLAQLVLALKVLWSVRAPAHVAVLLWQLSQLPVTVAWMRC